MNTVKNFGCVLVAILFSSTSYSEVCRDYGKMERLTVEILGYKYPGPKFAWKNLNFGVAYVRGVLEDGRTIAIQYISFELTQQGETLPFIGITEYLDSCTMARSLTMAAFPAKSPLAIRYKHLVHEYKPK